MKGRSIIVSLLLGLGAGLAACSGGSAPGGATDASDAGPDQTSAVMDTGLAEDTGAHALASLDDRCEGGPNGRDLLTFLRSEYSGTFTSYHSCPPATQPWTSGTPTALTISPTYGGGAIRCMPTRTVSCPPGAPCAAPTPPTLTVDMNVTFTTADGAFKETVVATVTLVGPQFQGQGAAASVRWDVDLPATKLAGTFPVSAGTADAVHLRFNGRFSPTTCDGIISEVTSQISCGGGTWTAVASDASTDGGSDAAPD
jgi:hypothetical protein